MSEELIITGRNSDLSNFFFNKVQPQAIELEESVLGALMIDKNTIIEVANILLPDCFYVPANKDVYEAILNLFNNKQPIDMLTVTEMLRKMGKLENVGGPLYIAGLTNRVGSSAHIIAHSMIVYEKFIKREIIMLSNQMIKAGYDESIDSIGLLEEASKGLLRLQSGLSIKTEKTTTALFDETIKKLKDTKEHGVSQSGIPIREGHLGNSLKAFYNGEYYFLGGRPGMGKSAFIKRVASEVIAADKLVHIVTLEMSSLQYMYRLISEDLKVQVPKLRDGTFDRKLFTQIEFIQKNYKSKVDGRDLLSVDDEVDITPAKLRSISLRIKSDRSDLGMIIIDYLQLMIPNNQKKIREQQIAEISREIKKLAKELDIPILLLGQLNRGNEARGGDYRPILSDIRESGSIEQDASVVMFIHRPAYYVTRSEKMKIWKIYWHGDSMDVDSVESGVTELIIAKGRDQAKHPILMKFVPQYTQLVDFPYHYYFEKRDLEKDSKKKINQIYDDTPF